MAYFLDHAASGAVALRLRQQKDQFISGYKNVKDERRQAER